MGEGEGMCVMVSPSSKIVRKWNMIEETVFTAPISQLRSWSFISELAGYEHWHPNYRFSQLNAQATHAQLSLKLFDRRRARLWIEIDHINKPQGFGWRGQISGLFKFSERYEILPAKTGAEVRHIFELRGGLGSILGWFSRRTIREEMQEHDCALLKALKKRALRPPHGKAQLKLVSTAPTRGSAND
ncbi:hypothetical protein YP76_17770 [Sphingobium chungbukense]|jgi:hypothetical protein|uniref:Polyketide cyclase n=2 Tax=Sphingobium chungbukense TaxID=56193 RepID=A0A0M3AQQ7_9SPHN|nr:hypothetical protein YP76_17770 [Sphingobium chungbukense]